MAAEGLPGANGEPARAGQGAGKHQQRRTRPPDLVIQACSWHSTTDFPIELTHHRVPIHKPSVRGPGTGKAHNRQITGSFRSRRYFARLSDLRGSPPLGGGGRTGRSRVLAGHRVSCCWRQGGFCVRAGGTGGVRHRSPASTGPVRAPGLTWGFWWQVQDSNLGRLSSAILQTVPGTALGEQQSHPPFGTHLTWRRGTGHSCR